VQRSSDDKPLGISSIPHARWVSEKFKRVKVRVLTLSLKINRICEVI
jgi:hypothetical protein